MQKQIFLIIAFVLFPFVTFSQIDYKIYELHKEISTIPKRAINQTSSIRISGVVTALMSDSVGVFGYYIQDKNGDGDRSTCDAIFISSADSTIQLGDEVRVVGFLTSSDREPRVGQIVSVNHIDKNQSVVATKVTFPDDFDNYSLYAGMLLEFDQTLYVTSHYSWSSGRVILSSHRLQSGVEVALPGSSDYAAVVTNNAVDQLTMVSSSSGSYPFADSNNTLRTGYRVDNLQGTLVQSGSYYNLQVNARPNFYGNARQTTHYPIGDYNVKVCALNLEYYLRSGFGTGFGPDDLTAANRQHNKLLKALMAIDADIYGVLEIQQGSVAIAYLCSAMNEEAGRDIYAYVADNTSVNGSYTKVGYIYRSDKITTKGSLQVNNIKTSYRKMLQGFTLISSNESFVLSLNHLKSKSGSSSATGDDADKNDGQGAYNAYRLIEVASVLSQVESYRAVDPDVLIMGDMNAYSMEDPIRRFESAGYVNLLKRFNADSIYSYSYKGETGLLDHALANNSMLAQVTGGTVFHINADEPAKFEYQNASTCVDDMYRCSDHDAVIVGLRLSGADSLNPTISTNEMDVMPNIVKYDVFYVCHAQKQKMLITDLSGKVMYNGIVPDEPYASFRPSSLGMITGYYVVRIINPKSDAIDPVTFKICVQ